MIDAHDSRHALRSTGLVREFNEIGVLAAADVHVARRLLALAGEEDELVGLAAALAVRAPRLGHVYVDLATIRDRATVDSDEPVDLSVLPWPEVGEWLERLRASSLIAVGDEAPEQRPLRLVDSGLYLDRYWADECQVAHDLRALDAPIAVDEALLSEGLERLFAGMEDLGQRKAAEIAVRRRLAALP
jgi:exodeoxyribonuclease V alpha subunit